MKLDHYPAQEPLSAVGAAYHARALALGEGIHGTEASYGPDPYQSLAIFRPEQPSGHVLLFLLGGGWTSGYKEWMYFMALALTVLGVTFVSAGYRLAPQHVFPVGVDDAADAFAWVVQHSDGHGGDPQRVFVGGHSAGGQYAAPRAATAEWRRARGLSEHCARGGLPISGVYRFGSERGLSVRPRFLGPAGHAETAASPLLHLQPATCPPMFITRGSRDFPHPIAQARQRASMLQATGVSVQTEVLEGADHFEASVAWGDTGSGWPTRATAWMRQVQTQSTPSAGEPR